MAEFKYKNGDAEEVEFDSQYQNSELHLSVALKLEGADIKVTGHTVVVYDGNPNDENVQFDDLPVGLLKDNVGKKLWIKVDVSKFKVVDKEYKDVNTKTTCTITLEAGPHHELGKYELKDDSNPESNSIFYFLFTFIMK